MTTDTTSTVQLTDAQLAQFTACGVIVVDGERAHPDWCSGDPNWSQCECWGIEFTHAPELWRKLTEPCATCGGSGVWNCREHDKPNGSCTWCVAPAPCPDCERGRQVVTLTATCPGSGGVSYCANGNSFSRHSGRLLGRCLHCFGSGAVTLGRFTVRLLPVVDDDDYEPTYAAVVVDACAVAYKVDDEGTGEAVALDPLPQPGQFAVEFEAVAP